MKDEDQDFIKSFGLSDYVVHLFELYGLPSKRALFISWSQSDDLLTNIVIFVKEIEGDSEIGMMLRFSPENRTFYLGSPGEYESFDFRGGEIDLLNAMFMQLLEENTSPEPQEEVAQVQPRQLDDSPVV